MKMLILTGLAVALALPLGAAGQRGAVAGCDPLGDVRFICNQVAPEDLALVPGGQWLISSGMYELKKRFRRSLRTSFRNAS